MSENKLITMAICGCGVRGLEAYAPYAKENPDKIQIVAGADTNPERLDLLKKEYSVDNSKCFNSAEEMLSKDKLADVMIISTQDKQHIEHAMLALEKNYHLILEKPISPDLQECLALQKKAHEKNRLVMVCHVLRYTDFYSIIKNLLDEGTIGQIQTVDAVENIAYWHFAHSYVRGNWRKQEDSSPSILAKCCHDMDILRWLIAKPCVRLSSLGGLGLFKKENAPKDSAKRCLNNCKAKENCPYDAEKIYLTNKRSGLYNNGTGWPCSVLNPAPTKENIYEALENGNYGRCVYHCDNDVADHQVLSMEFEDNITATFTMSAFTQECYRSIKIMGSMGEIEGDMHNNIIYVRQFGKEDRIINLAKAKNDFAGHGGGDMGLMQSAYDLLANNSTAAITSIDASIESHVMALAAENSRLGNGKIIELCDFAK